MYVILTKFWCFEDMKLPYSTFLKFLVNEQDSTAVALRIPKRLYELNYQRATFSCHAKISTDINLWHLRSAHNSVKVSKFNCEMSRHVPHLNGQPHPCHPFQMGKANENLLTHRLNQQIISQKWFTTIFTEKYPTVYNAIGPFVPSSISAHDALVLSILKGKVIYLMSLNNIRNSLGQNYFKRGGGDTPNGWRW